MRRLWVLLAVIFMTGCGGHHIPDCSDEVGCILFDSNRYRGIRHIFVMRPDGSDMVRLVPGREPVWSPDGRRIAFLQDPDYPIGEDDNVYLPVGEDDYVYLMNADGSEITRLTDRSLEEWSPTWSPDGRYIAFVSEGAVPFKITYELCVANVNGTGVQCFASDLAFPRDLAWSPDGNYLVFSAHLPEFPPDDEDRELFVVGTECIGVPGECELIISRLTDNSVEDTSPAWSPDGTRIAFACGSNAFGSDSFTNICVMDADGSNLVQLTTAGTWDQWPTWSPDGSHIAFASTVVSGTIYSRSEQISVMRADGSDVRRLTEFVVITVRDSQMPAGYAIITTRDRAPDWWGVSPGESHTGE